jgi:DNA repair protein RecO (recombination protein O)
MLATTDAIVLSLQPQSDKAHLLHAYTRTGGRVNYKVYGLGRKNTAGKYSPLSILQLTTDERSIRTAQLSYVPVTLITDPYKRTIALFLSEVLHHVLRHPMPDEPMFDFIVQAIEELDRTEEPQNFHLYFLVDFAAKLGFAIPSNLQTLKQDEVPNDFKPMSRSERQEALRSICDYFAEHVETWQEPKSLAVLTEVFD